MLTPHINLIYKVRMNMNNFGGGVVVGIVSTLVVQTVLAVGGIIYVGKKAEKLMAEAEAEMKKETANE